MGSTNLERGGKLTAICNHCGTSFATFPSRIKEGRSRFCSRACLSLFKTEAYKGRRGIQLWGTDNPNWRGRSAEKNCPICGQVFHSPNKTCSATCGHKLQALYVTMRGNGNWIDDVTYWKKNYRELADLSQCDACGSTKKIYAHHKDGDRNNNQPDNLAPLCNKCHSAIHFMAAAKGHHHLDKLLTYVRLLQPS